MDVIKDIPGYKVILKAVLKSQIQQLVEQLASVTDEESVLLTASVSDGTISHLGSNSGKNFLENHEDIKSQFLGFCLKYHHQKKQEEKDREEAEKLTAMSTSRFTSPSYMGVGSSMFPSPGQQEPHPIALTRARAVRPRVRHSPYTVQGLPARGQVLGGEASATVGGVIKIEPDNPQAVHLNLSGGDSVSELQGNVQSSFLESKQIVSSSPSQSGGLNNLDKDFSASESSVASQSVAPEHKSGSVSDSQDGATGSDNNESGKLNTSKSPSSNVSVKLEAITDAEMELEITGVEPGTQPVMPSGSQDWSQQGTMGYDPMGAAGNQSDMQAGNDGYTGLKKTQQDFHTSQFGEYQQLYSETGVMGPDYNSTNYPEMYTNSLFSNETKKYLKRERKKTYTCTVCGKGFRDRFCLERHVPLHTGERKFKCSLCDYKTHRKDRLQQHHMMKHV